MRDEVAALLWPHQLDAVRTVQRYLDSGSRRSSLVRMPTGTGKSGVIAVLSRLFDNVRCVLIVSPFTALRDQIADDVETRFWRTIGVNPTPREICKFVPSTAEESVTDLTDGGRVYVCTAQSLQTLFRNQQYRPSFAKLQQQLDLVIFDEGHREPAHEWAKAIRELQKPTVLVTATPYRNDHKLFEVDDAHVYRFPHQDAVAHSFIRDVRFREIECGDSNAPQFVERLLAFYDGEFQQTKPPGITPRVIIRCETYEGVKAVKDALETRRPGECVAIHERLNGDDEDEFCTVPNPRTTEATFWIHQFKLVEGIDDPRFCVLAIYQPFRNGRALVQQIGRVLRNPGRQPEQLAYVLHCPGDRSPHYWSNYLQYECFFDDGNRTQIDHRRLFDAVTVGQGEYLYFEGNFRKRFDVDADDAHQHLSYPLSATLFRVNNGFDLEATTGKLIDEWQAKDRMIHRSFHPDESTWIHLFTAYENSPILRDHVFVQLQLGYTMYRLKDDLLFYQDSGGLVPDSFDEDHVRRLDPKTLQSLLAGDTRVSGISLINSEIGRHNVRRRSLSAYSVLETAATLMDNTQFCSTATGVVQTENQKWVRRYVGFRRARLRDSQGAGNSFDDYMRWIDLVADHIAAAEEPQQLFHRFAPYVDPPSEADRKPASILLDIEDVRTAINRRGTQEGIYLPEVCLPVGNDSTFTLRANETDYEITIEYDERKRHFRLKSRPLERDFDVVDRTRTNSTESLVSYLNRNQAFRLVLSNPNLVYAHGQFYALNLTAAGHLDLRSLFIPIQELNTATSEKGAFGSADGTTWASGSIFRIIDTRGSGTGMERYLSDADLLVCDDLDNEMADFVSVNTARNRVCFIHAKAGGRHQVSASAFHEVCSQVVKNLHLLSPYAPKPQNVQRWDQEWNGPRIGNAGPRIRRGAQSGEDAWQVIQSVTRNPSANREVWIVVGAGFSLNAFDAERLSRRPAPEVMQIVYLLTATWASVSSVGATLRIFCSE